MSENDKKPIADEDNKKPTMARRDIIAATGIVAYLSVAIGASVFVAISLWGDLEGEAKCCKNLGSLTINEPQALLILALLFGVTGASLRGLQAVAKHTARRDFSIRWLVWYLIRPIIGGLIAVVGYVVSAAGLLGGDSIDDVNAISVAALSALAGLFSKNVLEKLAEVVNVVFTTSERQQYIDRLVEIQGWIDATIISEEEGKKLKQNIIEQMIAENGGKR